MNFLRSPQLELEEIQGLIVNGYASRPVASYAAFSIADPTGAARWLDALVDHVQFGEFLRTGRDEEPCLKRTFVNVAFTFAGLEKLGLSQTTLGAFHDSFREGMAAEHRSRQLGDDGPSAPRHWLWGGPVTEAVDGILCGFCGDEDSDALAESELHAYLSSLFPSSGAVRCLQLLPAHRSDKKEYRREHFGFRDGISNPGIMGLPGAVNRREPLPPGEFILGYRNIYDRWPLTPRVRAELDPHGILPAAHDENHLRDFGKNGSYLVFRQLEQDVAAFWRFAQEAAADLPEARSAIWLASRLVGRWPDGTPLTLSPDRDVPGEECDENVFRFGEHEDAFGSRCPVGAHIRRTNPRDTMLPLPHDPLVSSFPRATETVDDRIGNVNRHRVLRRGRLYGTPHSSHCNPNPGEMVEEDGVPRGLYFICFNTNLKRQFEFVQSTWCISPTFAGLSRDPDPLLASDRTHPFAANRFTIQGGPECPARVVDGVPRVVEVKGGAYFFMPSRCALRYLARP